MKRRDKGKENAENNRDPEKALLYLMTAEKKLRSENTEGKIGKIRPIGRCGSFFYYHGKKKYDRKAGQAQEKQPFIFLEQTADRRVDPGQPEERACNKHLTAGIFEEIFYDRTMLGPKAMSRLIEK